MMKTKDKISKVELARRAALLAILSGLVLLGAACLKLTGIAQEQEAEIQELMQYQDEFPGEFSLAIRYAQEQWAGYLECSKFYDPDDVSFLEVTLIAWDNDFQGYHCDFTSKDPSSIVK